MLGLGIKPRILRLYRATRSRLHARFARPQLYNLQTPERLGVIYFESSDMCVPDRVMLYALVRGLQPRRCVEIGTRWGGSALIITNALEENGEGRLIGIDPIPQQFRAAEKDLHGRFTLHAGYSPQAIPHAIADLGGPIDFAFVDGMHTHDAVLGDLRGLLPHLSRGAHILLHDAYHQGICRAVDTVLESEDDLHDLGFITRNPSVSTPVSYQGLRLLRYGEVASVDFISQSYRAHGLSDPPYHPALRNYDRYANRIGQGATELELKQAAELVQSGEPARSD